MLKEKARVINGLLTLVDVLIALVSFNLALYFEFGRVSVLHQKDSVILQLLILIFWALLSNGMGTNVMYRSRPFSVVLFNCLGVSFVGTLLLVVAAWSFNLFYLGIRLFVLFAVLKIGRASCRERV